jgi:transketolase
MAMSIDTLCVNTMRMLALDAVQRAKSGHPGMPLGAAPMAYVLWTKFMRVNPQNPFWPDRDRFVLSAGHGSALLYSILHLLGYEKMTLDELKNFRRWGSRTPGHPEYAPDCGVEATTGPLGQGFANAVGMAMAERHLAARFNRPGFDIVNHFTYAIASDGDMMEGVASEAASLAGHLGLGRLVCLYDSNHITLSAETRLTFTEDTGKRFEAYGWHIQQVEDGNDLAAIESALHAARAEAERPSLIIVRTHIGYGSPKQDTFEAHGTPLAPDDFLKTKEFYGWPEDKEFHIPEDALEHLRKLGASGAGLEARWNDLMERYAGQYPELVKELKLALSGELRDGWDRDIPVFQQNPKGISTRVAGGQVLNAIARRVPSLVGGSGDLDPSTMTSLKGKGSFQRPGTGDEMVQGAVRGPWGYEGANIAFGVREHAMGGILNGMAAHGGLIPFGSTFLIFSDYMRPAVRLCALSGHQVIYVFTHDSVGLGEDGPTHQPVEHIQSLRAMPNLVVIRPADANETACAWKAAIKHKGGPVSILLTRQGVPVIDRKKYAPAEGLHRGAYVLADCAPEVPDIILIATGSEVHPALEACKRLSAEGVKTRLVSMPSRELFEAQPRRYMEEVLPPQVTARLAVEAGATLGWHRYTGDHGDILGIDRFGASAPGEAVLEKLGFTPENIAERARRLLR